MLLLAFTNDPMAEKQSGDVPPHLNYFLPKNLLVFAQTVVHPVATFAHVFRPNFRPPRPCEALYFPFFALYFHSRFQQEHAALPLLISQTILL
ncbi:hypothetical protein BWI93_05500 [Siphonobacter sp. BAB-5385]|nr:hypothetical protein BWI93_05500 [Siphonobacter sp. BAB-5385]